MDNLIERLNRHADKYVIAAPLNDDVGLDCRQAAEALTALQAENAKIKDQIDDWQSTATAFAAENAKLRAAMLRAQLVFARYADLHATKGTPEGDVKAQANLDEANALARALKEPTPFLRRQPTSDTDPA